MQHAISMVQPYPRSVDTNKLLETLAQQHREPSIQSLMEPSGLDDLQHAANWEAVVQCVESLDAVNVHIHVRVLQL